MKFYHYDTCGLEHVYLLNGYNRVETADGPAVSIHNLDGLHQAIAEALVNLPRRLSGEEFRFLRIELDMSQKLLGSCLEKTDQSIAKWEKGEQKVPLMADVILRQLYMESIGKDSHMRRLINDLNQLDRKRQEKEEELCFSESSDGWVSVGSCS